MTASAAIGHGTAAEAVVPEPYRHLLRRLLAGSPVVPDRVRLVDLAAAVWSRPGFDTLIAGAGLAFEPFDYQLQTVATVLGRMRGRAILADEVGLGKTIEAALVLSELRARGLAGRALVVTPAGLVEQWREELERKFLLPTVALEGGRWDRSDDAPVVVASLAAARREPAKSALVGAPWDLIVMDEAHRLRNPRSASGRLARELTSRYLLLLTATPVENRLSDLYQLISLVAPGLLGTPAEFRRTYGADAPTVAASRVPELRRTVSQVTVRHRRSEVALRLPHRLAQTVAVPPSAAEQHWYAQITARIRDLGRDASAARRLALRSLARSAGSSPMAAGPTLRNLGWDDLAEQAAAVQCPAKFAALLDQLRPHLAAGEKVLVFTAFRQTLAALQTHLSRAGIDAAVYHGSLDRAGKESAIAAFRGDAPVLLSTESAGEGRNMQFCHVMINVDLPWNPMQIEQRVGRLHRVGQEHDVLVTNLVAMGTIEERILSVLESKINLFELVVGELDMILGRVDDDFDFETSVFDAFVGAADDDGFADRLSELGARLADARHAYAQGRGHIDALLVQEESA